MATARFIRKLSDWRTDARLYELDEPIEYLDRKDREKKTRYAIVSGAITMDGPETLVFPADKEGELLPPGRMLEVGGFRGSIDHDLALEEMGFDVL